MQKDLPMQNDPDAETGGKRPLERLYAQSLEDDNERFNTRNGVFYPAGFALLALPDERALSNAVQMLSEGGVPDEDLTILRTEQMQTLIDRSRHDAGILARIVAAELKQLSVLEQLAATGHQFLLIKYTDQSRRLLDDVGIRSAASKGLLFHALAVEELPVRKETIPGTSPFGVNEVIRSQDSDADMSGKHGP